MQPPSPANNPVLGEAAVSVGCFQYKYESPGFGCGEQFLLSKRFSYVILPGPQGNPARGRAGSSVIMSLNCSAQLDNQSTMARGHKARAGVGLRSQTPDSFHTPTSLFWSRSSGPFSGSGGVQGRIGGPVAPWPRESESLGHAHGGLSASVQS